MRRRRTIDPSDLSLRRRGTPLLTYLVMLILYSSIIFPIAAFLYTVMPDAVHKVPRLYWASVVLISVMPGVIWQWGPPLSERHERRVRKCRHGVKGGQTRGLCPTCVDDAQEAKERAERERREREQLEAMAAAADDLKDQELRRLSAVTLSKQEYLLSLSPQEFEEAVYEMFKKLGYSGRLTPMSNDRGKDIILRKDGEKVLVECKRYHIGKRIGRPPLQKLFAAMAEEMADRGIAVTTSEFAQTALDYAGDNKIDLIDGKHLAHMMSVAFPANESDRVYRTMCRVCGEVVVFGLSDAGKVQMCDNGHEIRCDYGEGLLTPRRLEGVPLCEKCGKKMRRMKTQRRGEYFICTGRTCKWRTPGSRSKSGAWS